MELRATPTGRTSRPPARAVWLAMLAAVLALPGVAPASNLIDRATVRPTQATLKLRVNKENVALLTYKGLAGRRRVAGWDAVNAIPPTRARDQERFKLRYLDVQGRPARRFAGGTFVNACRPYTGPKLSWLVTGCTAHDGSWWAVQAWQRALPNSGLRPTGDLAVWEIRLSHWSGELPVLTMKQDWSYGGRWEHLYGSVTYRGRPMHGFRTTSRGAPLDRFGVLVYIDTFNSAYGRGWRRENSFVTHNPRGIFCYGLYPHRSRPKGKGAKYRATMVGPGALPDIVWTGNSVGRYNTKRDRAANKEQAARFSDKLCRPN